MPPTDSPMASVTKQTHHLSAPTIVVAVADNDDDILDTDDICAAELQNVLETVFQLVDVPVLNLLSVLVYCFVCKIHFDHSRRRFCWISGTWRLHYRRKIPAGSHHLTLATPPYLKPL
ncbi:hypothetical protein R3P38DRAFT_3211829 [Favolaschia claudopus]|uniref:Uncharacterized protein n=1 Tax=Favolaschia claudopus TaxID=2862362 RepID=A0AAW0ADV8_9AGAR